MATVQAIGTHAETGRLFVVDRIGPINTLVVFTTLVVVPLLDIVRPKLPWLGIFAAVVVVGLVAALIVAKLTGKPPRAVLPGATIAILCVCAGLFGAGAIASSRHAEQGGLIAGYSATVKNWQDAWLVEVKQDTTAIRQQTASIETKLNQQSFMISQVLASMRPQYEKVLIEEVKGFTSLPKNQQDALVLLTSKVGTNGIKRYKRLTTAVAAYAQQPSDNLRKTIEDSTKYVAQVNDNTIEDVKSRLQILAMFFEPATFDYLLGNGSAQSDSRILPLFNIDPTKSAASQVSDPLGDFLASLQAKGVQVTEKVVIPQDVTKQVACSGVPPNQVCSDKPADKPVAKKPGNPLSKAFDYGI